MVVSTVAIRSSPLNKKVAGPPTGTVSNDPFSTGKVVELLGGFVVFPISNKKHELVDKLL